MSRRPVIGVTCYIEPARFAAWNTPASLLPQSYVDQITTAGGQPVLLPPVGDPATLVDLLDGLIIAGGGDVSPHHYGASPHPELSHIRDFRDTAELALVAAALTQELPLLGICRGMQILNVHQGGSLHQHLPDALGHKDHAPAPGIYGRIPVRIASESRLSAITKQTTSTPAHYHHQAIDRLGNDLRAAAWTPDGCIEAIELAGHPFALGVQWHPEVDPDTGLFAALIAAAG